jgi:hypothetical protein
VARLKGPFIRVRNTLTRGTERAIRRRGHRGYVGGSWEEFGPLQLDFMVGQGLQPHHVLCDVACGSLRAGVHFIPYLDAGNYLGIEKMGLLVERGIEFELDADVYEEKKPELVVSSEFEFSRFSKSPDFAIANSLFTHLTPELIELCLRNLREVVDECRFFVSFKHVDEPVKNPRTAADWKGFSYTTEQMERFGSAAGWSRGHYLGDWGHRRGLKMFEYSV